MMKKKLKPFWNDIDFSNINYISEEHQKLFMSGIEYLRKIR